MQFTIQGANYRDWYTITKRAENLYEVCRQGDGDYEAYEADRETVERLKSLATSEII